MRRNWLTDWEEAKRHPWRTRAASLVGFGMAGGVLILRAGDDLPWPSWIAIVVGFGVLGAAITENAMRQTVLERQIQAARALRTVGLQALVVGCGVGLAIAFNSLGVLVGSVAVVIAAGLAMRARRRNHPKP